MRYRKITPCVYYRLGLKLDIASVVIDGATVCVKEYLNVWIGGAKRHYIPTKQ